MRSLEKKTMKYIKLFCFLILLILISNQISFACSCFITPPPCYAYSQYDAVFVGTVKETKFDKNSFPPIKTTISIDKSYKGVSNEILYTETGATSCDFEGYSENKKFLIYGNLYEKDKTYFSTSYCSGSKIYDENLIDLDFLSQLNDSKPIYWVWGTITKSSKENYGSIQPLAYVQATVIDSNQRIVGTSDKNGNIKISVSKAGIYKVRVFPPKGTQLDGSSLYNSSFKEHYQTLRDYNFRKNKPFVDYEIEVKANKCGWFYLPLQKYEKE